MHSCRCIYFCLFCWCLFCFILLQERKFRTNCFCFFLKKKGRAPAWADSRRSTPRPSPLARVGRGPARPRSSAPLPPAAADQWDPQVGSTRQGGRLQPPVRIGWGSAAPPPLRFPRPHANRSSLRPINSAAARPRGPLRTPSHLKP